MFERGFKTWCERVSLELRKEIGLRSDQPLEAYALAKHLGIAVRTTADFPSFSEANRRILEADDGWSAVTLDVDGKKLIILKASNSTGRQSSDLMHELAHHLLDHRPSEVNVSSEGLLMLHSYSRVQESQADWLASCLLLPRPVLMHIKRRIRDEATAAREYQVSLAMLRFRLDVSGVNYQLARSRAAR